MKAYLAISGTIFVLIVIAHVLRVVAEGTAMVRDPFFVFTTLLAGALSLWAFNLFRVAVRRDG